MYQKLNQLMSIVDQRVPRMATPQRSKAGLQPPGHAPGLQWPRLSRGRAAVTSHGHGEARTWVQGTGYRVQSPEQGTGYHGEARSWVEYVSK